jgi:hypothetical protein
VSNAAPQGDTSGYPGRVSDQPAYAPSLSFFKARKAVGPIAKAELSPEAALGDVTLRIGDAVEES